MVPQILSVLAFIKAWAVFLFYFSECELMKELLMGNEAIAMGALMAGVNVVTGYPGTPSTEILETVAKRRRDRLRSPHALPHRHQ